MNLEAFVYLAKPLWKAILTRSNFDFTLKNRSNFLRYYTIDGTLKFISSAISLSCLA